MKKFGSGYSMSAAVAEEEFFDWVARQREQKAAPLVEEPVGEPVIEMPEAPPEEPE